MTTFELMAEYKNGNCSIRIFNDGTKIRSWDASEVPFVEYPESADIKITDKCSAKCQYCHEKSTMNGLHGDLDFIIQTLSEFLRGSEVAIGGGNPMDHPNLIDILEYAKHRGVIANITMNAKHLKDYGERIKGLRTSGLIHGLGISYNKEFHKDIEEMVDPLTIIHVIPGVNTPWEVMALPKNWKLLVLGYKVFGFGIKYYESNAIEASIKSWRYWINDLMRTHKVCFDNLGITQLNIESKVKKEHWKKLYMGDDGQYTMYIDCVKREFAKSSTSPRQSCEGKSIKEMFEQVKNKKELVIL